MDGTEVALAAIGLAASAVGGGIWLMKYAAKELARDIREHTKAAQSQAKSNEEMLEFMRNLNGRLRKTVQDKLKEGE